MFLKKMRAMSLIKAELMSSGKDPDIIERMLMDEYDRKEADGISKMIERIDLDNTEDIRKMMKIVFKRI